ncbi:hypothetical protein BLJAPNOD_02994 [Ensifer sp. M14]|uniref:hypothetical protein n=1 Tax=Ensifer sp. M14 TaxID=2203782 RepID=UPI000E1D39FF|nr:hypothetical protein [Ensifer sp. M14]RDL51848.1 hypothetical protein BLJAPNOD_02994 [Ensifer sp. M14]
MTFNATETLSLSFIETDAGKFVARAKCFLEGANLLKMELVNGNRMLFAPALHLAGQGLELLLKGCLIHHGATERDVKDMYGHRINEMWNQPQCDQLRAAAAINAAITHEEALGSGVYPDAAKVNDPASLFEEYCGALGTLHAGGGFPLRYPTEHDRMAPRTPLLIGTLWRTADDYAKRPTEFLSALG